MALAPQPDHPLARAVFTTVYHSRAQRVLRAGAWLIIALVHALRGMLFSWPVYAMTAAGFYVDAPLNVLLWGLGVPGIGISLYILGRAVREDYRRRVSGVLVGRADLARLATGRIGP
ncbi:MAG: hypothetical protein JSW09_08450 [Pseudomonadota bacterium]|nr:MAG: hypothetical protein JSW09_08450 [Pseudomonadota bacterium]